MLFQNSNKCLSKILNLNYDEACIDINNEINNTVSVFGQYEQCHECNFQNLTTLKAFQNTSLLVSTRSPLALYWTNGTDTSQCKFTELLYEHYRYGWNITKNCAPLYIKEPADDAYLAILMAFVVLFSFGTLWYMVKCIFKNSGRLRQLLAWSSELEEVANIPRQVHGKNRGKNIPRQVHGKAFIGRPCSKKAKELLTMSRNQLRITTGFMTGHAPVKEHLNKMGLYNGDLICRLCDNNSLEATTWTPRQAPRGNFVPRNIFVFANRNEKVY